MTTSGQPTAEAQELAYEHVVRALDQQAGVLDSVRARTATLIAVTSVVATFLGARALDGAATHKWVNLLAVLPLAAFAYSLGCCVVVLMPTGRDEPPTSDDGGPADAGIPHVAERTHDEPPDRRDQKGLRFTLNADMVLDYAATLAPGDEPLKAQVARNLQENWDANTAIVDGKLDAFTRGCWALVAQVVLWSLLLVVKEVM